MSECGCGCSAAPKLIFACSGAADVGAVADRAARKMTRDGHGKMFCLAGIGGRVDGIMKTTESAAGVLAVDGCDLDCAAQCLRAAGFTDFHHLRLSELGMRKGATPPTDETVSEVARRGAEMLS